MTSPPSPPNRHRRRVVVTIAVVVVGLCWWFLPVRDWLDLLQLLVVGVVTYGLCRYLFVATKNLRRTLKCVKCGSDALEATCSGTWIPPLGTVALYLCRSCGTRWSYNPFTKSWADAAGAQYERWFLGKT